jgi:hypothetical protein
MAGRLECAPHSGHSSTIAVDQGCPSGVRSHPRAAAGGACLRLWFRSLTLGLSDVTTASGHPTCYSSPPAFVFGVYIVSINICIYIFLHMLMYKKKTMPLHFRAPIPGYSEPGFPCLDHACNTSAVRGAYRRSS